MLQILEIIRSEKIDTLGNVTTLQDLALLDSLMEMEPRHHLIIQWESQLIPQEAY